MQADHLADKIHPKYRNGSGVMSFNQQLSNNKKPYLLDNSLIVITIDALLFNNLKSKSKAKSK